MKVYSYKILNKPEKPASEEEWFVFVSSWAKYFETSDPNYDNPEIDEDVALGEWTNWKGGLRRHWLKLASARKAVEKMKNFGIDAVVTVAEAKEFKEHNSK